jgi:hypothetical protein
MSFQNQGILWGLLALAIPILIHFFNFRKLKRESFSNIAFLKEVTTKAKSFFKLKQRLILLSRLLFIGALVLAFAQPYIPNKLSGNLMDHNAIAIYIDNSQSMQAEANGKAALDVAIRKVEKILDVLPKNTKLVFANNDFSTADFKNHTPQSARNEVTRLSYSGMARNVHQVLGRLRNLADKKNFKTGNFLYFTDFQKNTIGDLSKIELKNNGKLYLAPITSTQAGNVYVDSLWLDNPFIRAGQANVINVRIKNIGNATFENLSTKLLINDTQIAAIPSSLAANESKNLRFDINISSNYLLKGKINISDSPIVFDNNYFFTIKPSPKINIIHLAGLGSSGFVNKAFLNDSLFTFSSFQLNNFNLGLLPQANMLVVENATVFSENLGYSLVNYVKNGGTLLLIPPKNIDYPNYNKTLNVLGISNLRPNNFYSETLSSLSDIDKNDGFFKNIFENTKKTEKNIMPMTNEKHTWATYGNKILKTKGGQNYMTYTKAGKGKVVFMANNLEASAGNFAENPLFVPILYKIAANSLYIENMAYRFDNQYVKIEKNNFTEKNKIKFKNIKREFIPTYTVGEKEVLLEIPSTSQTGHIVDTGYYDIEIDGKVANTIALNNNAAESVTEYYTAAELKKLVENKPNVQILDEADAIDFAENFKNNTQGLNLWKYLVWAALLFLALEVLLVRFWKE